MRLDKFLVHTNTCNRSEARNLVRSGRVLVNGAPVASSDFKINENTDIDKILDVAFGHRLRKKKPAKPAKQESCGGAELRQ